MRNGRGSDLLTVVGAPLGAQPGESLRLQGWRSSHPQYGRQFEVVSYTPCSRPPFRASAATSVPG